MTMQPDQNEMTCGDIKIGSLDIGAHSLSQQNFISDLKDDESAKTVSDHNSEDEKDAMDGQLPIDPKVQLIKRLAPSLKLDMFRNYLIWFKENEVTQGNVTVEAHGTGKTGFVEDTHKSKQFNRRVKKKVDYKERVYFDGNDTVP